MISFVYVLLYDVKIVNIYLLYKHLVKIFLLFFKKKVFPNAQKIKEKHHLRVEGDSR
tara:strand:+ start:3504 stop:3674 length:171 start_codon:yes stop_codon:yes gene_type:complete